MILPFPTLHRTDARVSGMRITTWESPATLGRVSEDALLVSPTGSQNLRAAALDGVTPTALTPGFAGVTGGVWASGVVSAALRNQSPILDALRGANEALHQAGLTGRDQAQATAAVADVAVEDGTLICQIVTAGDCVVWARSGETWTQLCATPMLDPRAQDELVAWRLANPDAPVEANREMERTRWADPSVWNSTPVGRFPELRVQSAVVRADELVLATDGALLENSSALEDLEGWLAQVRTREAAASSDGTRYKRHDDLAVIRIVALQGGAELG